MIVGASAVGGAPVGAPLWVVVVPPMVDGTDSDNPLERARRNRLRLKDKERQDKLNQQNRQQQLGLAAAMGIALLFYED